MRSQLEKLFAKRFIDPAAMENEYLLWVQQIFGLGYDQFDSIKEPFVLAAVEDGANICDLETALDLQKVKSKTVDTRKEYCKELLRMSDCRGMPAACPGF